MTSIETELVGAPLSARASMLAHERTLDALAGRTVWCAAPLAAARAAAEGLSRRLRSSVPVTWLPVTGDEEPRHGGEQLDAALHGSAAGLRPARYAVRELASGPLHGDERVSRDDVVVMHDALSAALTEPLRERGAHAIWYISDGTRAIVGAVWELMRPQTTAIDAYAVSWREGGATHLAAFMPALDRVTRMDLGPGGDDEGWSGLLAAVVRNDRTDRVGGVRRARPVVAIR